MKEEIEKVSGEVIDWLDPVAYGLSEGLARTLKDKIRDAIITQVEKARREAIEECAICAEDTKFLETCSERIVALVQLRHRIAKAIRNKIEKE